MEEYNSSDKGQVNTVESDLKNIFTMFENNNITINGPIINEYKIRLKTCVFIIEKLVPVFEQFEQSPDIKIEEIEHRRAHISVIRFLFVDRTGTEFTINIYAYCNGKFRYESYVKGPLLTDVNKKLISEIKEKLNCKLAAN